MVLHLPSPALSVSLNFPVLPFFSLKLCSYEYSFLVFPPPNFDSNFPILYFERPFSIPIVIKMQSYHNCRTIATIIMNHVIEIGENH